MPKEKDLRSKMIKHIKALPNAWCVATHGGPHTPNSGQPDICACIEGVMLQIEVKLPSGNKPTRLQTAVIWQWRRAQAVAGYVTTMGQLGELIDLVVALRDGAQIEWPEELLPGATSVIVKHG